MNTEPYGALRTTQVLGQEMAYVDEGEGDTIVFQHGNPTSSYLWRNVMPHLEGLGRLVACDLIGMGGSAKLPDSGPDRYTYAEHREFLFALWDHLALGDRVILVVHDWGSVLGFDWAFQHQDRVQGIVHFESIVTPLTWSDWPDDARRAFQGFRSDAGEAMVIEKNMFVERILPASMIRDLDEAEMAAYRAPYLEPGESRRPTLTWPREIPIEGTPELVDQVVRDYEPWLASAAVPKLFINGEPGSILVGRQREVARSWANQTEVSVPGIHFLQEDSPDEIGRATADFVRRLRS